MKSVKAIFAANRLIWMKSRNCSKLICLQLRAVLRLEKVGSRGTMCYKSHEVQRLKSARTLLEVITVKLATRMSAIQEYITKTLLFHTIESSEPNEMDRPTLNDLVESGLVEVNLHGGYTATPLSQATVASYLTPEDGLFIHRELRRALKAFVMDGEMHIFYTFAPV